jgi:hypothetical protein
MSGAFFESIHINCTVRSAKRTVRSDNPPIRFYCTINKKNLKSIQ